MQKSKNPTLATQVGALIKDPTYHGQIGQLYNNWKYY